MSIIEKLKDFGKHAVLCIASLTALYSTPARAEADFLDRGTVERSFVNNHGLSSDTHKSVDEIIEGIPIQRELNEEATEKANKNLKKMFGPEKDKQSETGGQPYQLELNVKKDLETKLSNPFLEVPAYSLAAFIGTVFWHELGHARKAIHLGGKDVQIHGPKLSRGSFGSSSFGIPESMTDYEMNIISAAGTEATTVMAHYLYQSLKTGKVPDQLKPFVATTALFMLADRHRYLWSSAIKNYLRMDISPGNDFQNIMENSVNGPLMDGFYVDADHIYGTYRNLLEKGHLFYDDDKGTVHEIRPFVDKEGKFRKLLDKDNYENIVRKPYVNNDGRVATNIYSINPKRGKNQKNIDIAYSVALGMSALELGLRHKEIAYLVSTALGGNPKTPEGMEVLKAGFYPIPNGFFISVDGIF